MPARLQTDTHKQPPCSSATPCFQPSSQPDGTQGGTLISVSSFLFFPEEVGTGEEEEEEEEQGCEDRGDIVPLSPPCLWGWRGPGLWGFPFLPECPRVSTTLRN